MSKRTLCAVAAILCCFMSVSFSQENFLFRHGDAKETGETVAKTGSASARQSRTQSGANNQTTDAERQRWCLHQEMTYYGYE